jgi:hypothetical protein
MGHTEREVIEILECIADKFGYKLTKKKRGI